MSQRIVITGPSGGAPNRLEISRFVRNDKFFSLYIQALQRMQNANQAEFRSYFQVGGIHGRPYTPWDGANGTIAAGRWGGYCTHSSVLFPTWHRPYVSLYEQILQDHAKAVAETYTTADRAEWIQAAAALRQPYWDWAANPLPPDQVIYDETVRITGPAGTNVMVPNPLRQYQFNPIPTAQFTAPFTLWATTLRRPTTQTAAAVSNVQEMARMLGNWRDFLTDSTYAMLTRLHDWNSFSNTSASSGATANSLEAIHDDIHDIVGGSGHMGNPEYAGFDPIFQLHHANVDRMLSLWAALNPGVWVSPGNSGGGSFTIAPGGPVNASTALTPFWNTNTSFWPSSTMTGTGTLGYSYPEFNGLDMNNPEAVRAAIGREVNRLYGITRDVPASEVLGESERVSTQSSVGDRPPNHGVYDWIARIQFKKFELGTSFAVPLFFGPAPDDPKEWLVSSNFVGAHHGFVNGNPEECENCRNQADLIVEGFVHLNRGIIKHSGLDSLEEDVIAPYLTNKLNWKVIKADGEPAELDSLEVHIMSVPLTYPTGAMFPVGGTPRHHHKITSGRRGGSRTA